MAVARVDTQRRLRKTLLYELAPNLIASATLSGRAGGVAPSNGEIPQGAGWLPGIGNWHVGLVLQWNVFDASVLSRRSGLLAREQAAEADLQVVRDAVRLAAGRAFLELDAAKRAQPSQAELVKAATANQAQAEARFRAGLGTAVERADAEALLTTAQLEVAIGRFELARARALLGRVIGEQLIDLRAPRGAVR
jgi:outer membrane protein TolC